MAPEDTRQTPAPPPDASAPAFHFFEPTPSSSSSSSSAELAIPLIQLHSLNYSARLGAEITLPSEPPARSLPMVPRRRRCIRDGESTEVVPNNEILLLPEPPGFTLSFAVCTLVYYIMYISTAYMYIHVPPGYVRTVEIPL